MTIKNQQRTGFYQFFYKSPKDVIYSIKVFAYNTHSGTYMLLRLIALCVWISLLLMANVRL